MSVQAAKRYAKALFELAEEKELLEQVASDLHGFASVLEQLQSVRTLFYSIHIKVREKQQLFDSLLKDKSTPYMLNFVKVLFQKRREHLFDQIIKKFDGLYDKKLGRVHAKIISAVPLEETTKETMKAVLAKTLNATILMETLIDPTILGGFILQIEDELLDASLRRKFEMMKASLQRGILQKSH